MTSEQMQLYVNHIKDSEILRRSWNQRIESWIQTKQESGLWTGEVVNVVEEWSFEQI